MSRRRVLSCGLPFPSPLAPNVCTIFTSLVRFQQPSSSSSSSRDSTTNTARPSPPPPAFHLYHLHLSRSRSAQNQGGEAWETVTYNEARSRRRLGSFAFMVAPVGGVDRNPVVRYNGCVLTCMSRQHAAGLACDPDLLRRDPGEGLTARRVRAVCVFGDPKSSFRLSSEAFIDSAPDFLRFGGLD